MVGWVRITSLMEMFSISRAQASKDFQGYQLLRPNNLRYNKSAKYYEISDGFMPLLLTGKTSELLSIFHTPHTPNPPVLSLTAYQPHASAINPLDREIDLTIFRLISNAAYNHRKVKILYQSLTQADSQERIISPHTLVYSGYRWHIRAYSEHHQAYRDFVLARIKNVPTLIDEVGIDDTNDTEWHTQVPIVIGPHPNLSDNHKTVIVDDYGMCDDQITVQMRGALVGYFLKLMHLEPSREHPDAKVQQIVVLNKDVVKHWVWGE
ncbi:WYL domain-containing protein [Sulfuriferula nivalis]|uniref:WYL domain-containing protein n=2 Tax=Sulfuriferula nivalis TaxID=2675298 RepID=A0A809RFA8_9PROT|nr:WYL domain-containing protein [Sulfuriferula nivalis]